MLNELIREFRNIPENYKQKISLDNMVKINTGFLNIEFYANNNYSPEQDKHIVNETSQHINILLKEKYTDNSFNELLALISAELRGGMIFIAQLLEDAQFLREWEERNKFRPYFSMSLDDTFERHSFLFKIFDTNPLYLLKTEDLKDIDEHIVKKTKQIDEQIKIYIEELKKTDNKPEFEKIKVEELEEYAKEHKIDDFKMDELNLRILQLTELQKELKTDIPLLDTYIQYKEDYIEQIQKKLQELKEERALLNNLPTELDKYKYLLRNILKKHIEEQKKFDILSQFKYSLDILQSINDTDLNRFKIVRKLMDPKYDDFSIENIVKIIITEFNNLLTKSDVATPIEQRVNMRRREFIDEQLIRKKLIFERFAIVSPSNQIEFNKLFLSIIKEEGFLNINITKLSDVEILNFYNTNELYRKLSESESLLIKIIRYIFIQPYPKKKKYKTVFTNLEPFEKINYYENLKHKIVSEGYMENVTNKRFDEIMDHIIENIPQIKKSRYQTSSNKTLLRQLREKNIIEDKDKPNILDYDKMIEYIEEYVIVETNAILNDMFLYEVFESLGYIITKTTDLNKLTSFDDLYSLYDLLSMNNKVKYTLDTSLIDMLKDLPETLRKPSDDKLIEFISKTIEYNSSNNENDKINILFFIITQTKQLLLGDRLTLLKYYSKDNNHVYYNIYPVTRQPTNISGLLIKLFAYNYTFAHNKYPVRIMFPEKTDYLYENTFYTGVLNSYTFIGIMCINIKHPKYILIYKKIYDLTKLPEYKFATPIEQRYDLLTLVEPSLFHFISINSANYRLKNYENPMNMVLTNGVIRDIPSYYVDDMMHTKTILFTKMTDIEGLKDISLFSRQLVKPLPKKMPETALYPRDTQVSQEPTRGSENKSWRKNPMTGESENKSNDQSWRNKPMTNKPMTNNPSWHQKPLVHVSANPIDGPSWRKISGGYKNRYEIIKNDYIKL